MNWATYTYNLIEKSKIDIKYLAKKLGTTKQYLYSCLSNKKPTPSSEKIIIIFEELDKKLYLSSKDRYLYFMLAFEAKIKFEHLLLIYESMKMIKYTLDEEFSFPIVCINPFDYTFLLNYKNISNKNLVNELIYISRGLTRNQIKKLIDFIKTI